MGWFRVDDDFLVHPKVVSLSAEAKMLFIAGLAYSSATMSDGCIPRAALMLLGCQVPCDPRVVKTLVKAGLWDPTKDGFKIHNYHDYQRTKAQVRADKEANRERVRRFRSKAKGNGVRNGVSNAITEDPVMPLVMEPQHSTDIPPSPPSGSELQRADEEHKDRAVIDHLAQALEWDTPRRRGELRAVWDWGRERLDERVLEDTLLGCRGANHPNYLRQAVVSACRANGIDA